MTRLFDSRKANSLIFHELEPYEFTLFKKVVRSLREAINLNSFSDEIHGLPSIEKFIASMGSLTISRVGATRIYACGDRYLRNRPAQTGWKGSSMVVEAGSSEASAEE